MIRFERPRPHFEGSEVRLCACDTEPHTGGPAAGAKPLDSNLSKWCLIWKEKVKREREREAEREREREEIELSREIGRDIKKDS